MHRQETPMAGGFRETHLDGPVWTQARVKWVLGLRCGVSAAGLDLSAIAAELAVTPRVLRTWIGAGSGTQLASLTADHLDLLQAFLQPDPDIMVGEDTATIYARRAIRQLSERAGLAAWEKQGWIDPHIVVIAALPGGVFYQIIQTRDTPTHRLALARRGLVEHIARVPTRFHATILANRVLNMVQPWRFQANKSDVPEGPTRVWLSDAPVVSLAHTWAKLRRTNKW